MGRSSSFLDIIIGAKDETRKGVQGAKRDMDGLESSTGNLKTTAIAMTAATGGLVAAWVAATKTAIAYGSELVALEQRLGLNVETAQELKFAFEQNNIAFNTGTMAIQRLQRRAAEAAKGFGEAQGALKELGLDAQLLSEVNLDDALALVADALSKVETESERTQLSFKLFDSEGVALKQTLAGGADELLRLKDQARETGQVLAEEHVRQLEAMDRKYKEVTGTIETFIKRFVVASANVLADAPELPRRGDPTFVEVGAQNEGPILGPGNAAGQRQLVFQNRIAKVAEEIARKRREELEAMIAIELASGKVQVEKLESIREELDVIQAITEEQRAGVGHVENVRDAYNALGDQLRLTEQLTAEIGGTMVDLAFEFADQMGLAFADALLAGESFKSSMTAIFRSIVNSAIAELARLAARRAVGSFLGSLLKGAANILLPGSGVVLDQIDETLAGTAPLGPTLGLAGGRPAVFNIQINAGFGTRGEGVAAARAIVSYAREAGL